MSTLILPCAGRSSRFPNMKPKWLLTHPQGELVIQKSISGIDLNKYDRVIITITKEHVEKFDAKLIIEQAFLGRDIEICVLDNFTSSQSETIYLTLKYMNVTSMFVVKDSDNFVSYEVPCTDNFVIGLDISTYANEVLRLKSKSFLVLNEQNQIIDIIEKQIKSNIICLGTYGFDSADKFSKAFTLLKKYSKNNVEIYPSHIIAYLIGTGQSTYQYKEATNFEDWGTLEDWVNVQKKYSTYFIDVDGVLLKNCGKYGKINWTNNVEILQSNIDLVNYLSKNGAQIIFTTARTEDNRKFLEDLFHQHSIQYYAIIMGCNHTNRFIINDFSPTNPYPSCVAVNIPRDSELGVYLTK